YEETYRISQLSPKSAIDDRLPEDTVLKTSQTENFAFRIEPSALFEDPDFIEDIVEDDEATREDRHFIVARSADPTDDIVRESRSINIDEIPSSNNEIDNELELHHKRKYYDIHPTKTRDFLHSHDDVIMSSSYGDRLEFRFPGEGKRVPYGRALSMGPRIRPSAVQPIFATVSHRDEGRQNTEIQNIITGIVKLLNGNVNVHANTQLLGRPTRPLASRINNRGPPRISDVPPLPDFDKPLAPLPPHSFIPTKTPPPYPFDRPPVHVNLPEQIVPPLAPRPGLHRPMPPWQRPRPPNRPPNRRPNPGLPMYNPNLPIIPYDIPEIDDEKPEGVSANENETIHSENNLPNHHEEVSPTPAAVTEVETDAPETTTTTEASTEQATTLKTTTELITTEKIPITTTTEKPKTEKPVKIEKEKKKETPVIEKDKPKDKYKEEKTTQSSKIDVTTQKTVEKTTESKILEVKLEIQTTKPEVVKNETLPNNDIVDQILQNKTLIEQIIEPSLPEPTIALPSSEVPTPTEGLVAQVPVVQSSANIEPRPGIVLDDPDFKPGGSRYRPDASVITAAPPERAQGFVSIDGKRTYLNLFDTSTPGPSSIAPTRVQSLPQNSVSTSGAQGFVSIDGKRTYLNLFDTSTPGPSSIAPTRVQSAQGFVSIDGKRTYLNLFDTSTPGPSSIAPTRVQSLPQNSVLTRMTNTYNNQFSHIDPFIMTKSSFKSHVLKTLTPIDSAFSMTPFSDDFVSSSVNAVHEGDGNNRGVFVNYTI
ncbi:63 kDa sperm flagellar membrane protein, partial [Operophtera brumata]